MWFTATNPDVLLDIVWHRPLAYSGAVEEADLPAPLARRLRLYGVACARTVWALLSTDMCNAVRLSECLADGRATATDVSAAAVRMRYGPTAFQHHAVDAAGWASAGYFQTGQGFAHLPRELMWNPVEAARSAAKALATRAAGPAPAGHPTSSEWEAAWNATFFAARTHQAELVRDIFPPPGYAPRLDPDWRTSTVVALASQMDASGDFSAVPILADALQDAGCADDVMLDRCRAPSQVHCRGNWVVDLVLGRE